MTPQRYRPYAPGSVGCCTIGVGGLVESVLVVVVDAPPSSRVKAMIHVIIGGFSCLALLFPRKPGAWAQNFVYGMRGQTGLQGVRRQIHAMRKFDTCFPNGWLAESERGKLDIN
jgi:hypothetical protein